MEEKVTSVPEPVLTEPRTGVQQKEAPDTLEERQVIVHCLIESMSVDHYVRIWSSTYLRDRDSSHKSRLLTAFNITFFPRWTFVAAGRRVKFTLVFSALPSDCLAFDLFEDIPEGGGFYTGIIGRNKTDVYEVDILS